MLMVKEGDQLFQVIRSFALPNTLDSEGGGGGSIVVVGVVGVDVVCCSIYRNDNVKHGGATLGQLPHMGQRSCCKMRAALRVESKLDLSVYA